jgi:hypothetical protein
VISLVLNWVFTFPLGIEIIRNMESPVMGKIIMNNGERPSHIAMIFLRPGLMEQMEEPVITEVQGRVEKLKKDIISFLRYLSSLKKSSPKPSFSDMLKM